MAEQVDTSWSKAYELPPAGNMMSAGAEAAGVFLRQGTRMARVIERLATQHLSRPFGELDVLDFACGVGRIALPLYAWHKRPNACADVDGDAIAYLKTQIPGASPVVTSSSPPTPYPSASFDLIYSISLWTHLPIESQWAWLDEIRRLLRANGVALVSTSGFAALEVRRKRVKGWETISDDTLREKGMIFIETPKPRGVTTSYGYAAHDPSWIAENWKSRFSTIETHPSAIENIQDLNVLKL